MKIENISIKKMNENNIKYAIQIANSLVHQPKIAKWFTPAAIEEMKQEFNEYNGFMAYLNDNPVGFISYKLKKEILDITWIGVIEELHDCGIGTRLIKRILQEARNNQIAFIDVETLAAHHADENYKKTIGFYKSRGFAEHKICKEKDSGKWDILVMRKSLE